MMTHKFAKHVNGFIIPDDLETKSQALAEIFCDMFAEEQAAFFNRVQHISSQWPGANRQWRGMEKYLDPAAREMLKDMHDHTGAE